MPMLEYHDQLFIGTVGSGLFVYDGKNISRVKGQSEDPGDQNVKVFSGRMIMEFMS